jgi:hypothetical protein
MRIIELVERGAHAVLGILILGHLVEDDEAHLLLGFGDLDGVDDMIERCTQVHDGNI